MGNISISVIVPAHNSQLTIKACLDSLNSQSIPREEYEIIVVDDGSNDNTIDLAKTCFVNNIISVKHCSVGTARNIGAKSSKGKIIAFLDSDCKASKGWLEAISRNLSSTKALTGPILNGNPQSLIAWGEYFVEFGGYFRKNKISKIRFIPGCNQALTREAFFKTSGFSDEWLSEDVLFGENLKSNNIDPYYVPQMEIWHLCRTKLNKVLGNMRILGIYSVRTRKLVSTKYGNLFLRKIFIPIIFLGKISISMCYGFKGKKISKSILSFPYIILASAAFCKGVWAELKK